MFNLQSRLVTESQILYSQPPSINEEGINTCSKFDSKPPGERHNGVVIDMEKRDLAVLFSEYKKDLGGGKTKQTHI